MFYIKIGYNEEENTLCNFRLSLIFLRVLILLVRSLQ